MSPHLATILVGNDHPSEIYSRLIDGACRRTGIAHKHHVLPQEVSEDDLTEQISSLNCDQSIHGILVHRPLPSHIDESLALSAIDPGKDIDGADPLHLGRVAIGKEGTIPCAPQAVITVLERYDVELQGKHAVVVGHSSGVGKPMTLLLLNRNATVTSCHIYTEDLQQHTKRADILVAAAGVKSLITGDMVKKGVVILDIGGDVCTDAASKASLFTPTPGGIGPITVALLAEHTVTLAEGNEL